MYVQSARGRRVAVELCMKDELVEGQRHLDRLTRAYLPDAGVSSAGPRGEVAAQAGSITVLDLQVRAGRGCCGAWSSHGALTCCALTQGALLPDWESVARLNEELPGLQVLDLRCGDTSSSRQLCVGPC